MLRVTINGAGHELEEGVSILDALRRVGVSVPTLCHDERLKPYGGCRLCVVDVEGWERPPAACTTPVTDGMVIDTHSPAIESHRRTLLGLLASRFPRETRDDAVSTSTSPPAAENELLRLLRQYDLADAIAGVPDPALVDDSHPYLHVDMSRCVYCFRCVRICDEVQGQFVWRVWNRGDETRILPDGPDLLHSSCVSCGACVDTCPSGALEDKTLLERGAPSAWVKTTCPYCGTGCEMTVGTRDGRISTVRPVPDAPVNKGHLCVKGRYAFDFTSAADRVTSPMLRDGGEWKKVSWATAIDHVAERLRALATRHGADSVAVLGSARATNEDNYLAQKLARLVLGTNNVECCARVCHTPSAAALKTMLGAGAATNGFDDIEQAALILVCGANPTENHPIVGARIKQAVRAGAGLIVIDPRRIELARWADCHLTPRPGTNLPLLYAMAHTIVRERLCDEVFLEARVTGVEEFAAAVDGWTPERAAGICGVDAGEIRRAARLYAGRRPAMTVHGLGLTEHIQGTDGVMALIDLALLTGNVGRPGSGVNPLRGQNNVQGAAHMGCDRSVLTGGASIADPAARQIFERVWGSPLPATRGLHLLEMMDAAAAGALRALWVVGYDVFLTLPQTDAAAHALQVLDLLVVQDLFLNETARSFGTVFLPACSPFEKDGTFMNADRRIQRVRGIFAPAGESKPDWEIFCSVARSMGRASEFDYASVEEVWDEIRTVWPDAAGITYSRLERGGLQWPCPTEDHPGTRILHRDSFGVGQRAALHYAEYEPTPERVTEEFPFLLNTGRTLYHFNAGTMTLRTRNTVLRPRDLLDISPADAERLGVDDGEPVRLTSRWGATVLHVHLEPALEPGQLFATFHTAETFLNRVTGPTRDRTVGTPEYKVVAVRIERVPRAD